MSDERTDPRLTGRIGGLTAWSRNGTETMLGPAHRGFRRRFEREVIESAAMRGEVLDARQVAVRADRARRAWMLGLAVRSATARRKKAPPAKEMPIEARETDGGSRRHPPSS